MIEENISQEFRLGSIDETRSYFFEQVKENELICRKHKKPCTTLNYTDHFLILASTTIGCISVSTFACLLGVSMGIRISAIGLKICAIVTVIKKYKSIIKKKEKEIW